MYSVNDEKLSRLIPNIKAYPSKSGAEGIAYFIDKEFVVKYFERMNVEFNHFDNYCNEIQQFGNSGFSCPKIYSWAKVPICKEDNVYKYYILEEQIPGEVLLPYSIGQIEEKTKTFCSKDEFVGALNNIEENKTLYLKLMEEYTNTVKKRSEQLEALSVDEIRKFINSYIQINKNSMFSSPDFHVGNVLFDGDKITLIDELMAYRGKNKWLDYDGDFNKHRFDYYTLSDLVHLFSCIRNINVSIQEYEHKTGEDINKNIILNVENNKKILGEFMQKWVRESKNLLVFDEELTDEQAYAIFRSLKYIIDEKSEQNILKEFGK